MHYLDPAAALFQLRSLESILEKARQIPASTLLAAYPVVCLIPVAAGRADLGDQIVKMPLGPHGF